MVKHKTIKLIGLILISVNNWVPVGKPSSFTYSDVHHRIITSKTPQLKCPHKDDSFTVNATEKGNGKLTNPVGLITADEAWLAGGNSASNSSYYLYTSKWLWTLSPFAVSNMYTYHIAVTSIGSVEGIYADTPCGYRPVVSLIPNSLNTGTGEWNNPYRIE